MNQLVQYKVGGAILSPRTNYGTLISICEDKAYIKAQNNRMETVDVSVIRFLNDEESKLFYQGKLKDEDVLSSNISEYIIE